MDDVAAVLARRAPGDEVQVEVRSGATGRGAVTRDGSPTARPRAPDR